NKHKRSRGGKNHPHESASSVVPKKISTESPEDPETFEDLPKILQVKHSDMLGRYLVTTRDVRPGETLLSGEEALVSGPCQGGSPALCLGCCATLALPLRLGTHCTQCGLPMCGVKCPGLEKHRPECELLCAGKAVPLAPVLLDERPELYNAIVPLRCLYLRDKHPDKWKTLMSMEAHNEIRRARPTIWRTNQEYVVQPIREMWSLGDRFSELEIHTVCGILEVNAFEVGPPGRSIRALYPRAFLMAHDCVPNTCHTDDSSGRLKVRASTQIRAGSSVTLSYAYTLQGTLMRRQHLREGKFFECKCASEARVLSTNPLNDEAEWSCEKCHEYIVAASSVHQLLSRLGDEAEVIDPNSVQQLEQHYLMLGVKHSLSQVYGKVAGFLINDLSEEQLKRKRDICREILPVFDILEPGMSRLRGVTLYELHAPLMVLATRAAEARTIMKSELQAALREVANCLERAAAILSFEPEGSEERSMAEAAAQGLEQVTEWRRRIGNAK
ncbi:hypothetical protein B566_EDAN006745, partial [Ephemera danica]